MEKRRLRRIGVLGGAYLLAGLALSSIDITFAWFSPISDGFGGMMPWYASAGISHGAVAIANHESLRAGFNTGLHGPELWPLSIGGGVGPEGGIAFVSTWFLVLMAWGIHLAAASLRARQNREFRAGTRPDGAAEPAP